MIPFEPRTQAALDAAMGQIMTTAGAVVDRVSELLGTMALTSTRAAQRDLMLAAQFDLRRNIGNFHRAFKDSLRERVHKDAEPTGAGGRRPLAATDWQSLSLVDDHEVEERMSAGRIGALIAHECEWERREVAAHMGTLLRTGTADEERNPLRPDVIGHALARGIEAVTTDPEVRKALGHEIGLAISKAMVPCYRAILADLQARGIQPVGMTVRTFEGPGTYLHGVNTGYQTVTGELVRTGGLSHPGGFDAAAHGAVPAGARGPGGGGSGFGGPASGRSGLGGHSGPGSGYGGGAHSVAETDAQLTLLLRRLTSLASRPDSVEGAPPQPTLPTGPGSDAVGAPVVRYNPAASTSNSGLGLGALPSASGLMAVNLIRAHREELLRATPGQLDHMVIDVVGSLFDQILSDPRVPPQMARQIARLQLPVLRVALHDATFFSSRRHPVRRFVNRIASLACAFDEFDDGPGKEFLERVRRIVQEIVEGDFDQIELYALKLAELEAFIGDQTQGHVQGTAAAATLEGKESELRVQQRYMLQLQAALQPVSLPAYLREFLTQVWSQALVLAVRRHGKDSEMAQRFRRAGRELVMSVQPKGSPNLRKKFLMQLPGLMKDLNEGIALIGWSDAAKKAFFGQLLPAHAESLKGEPLSELDYNMLSKQLEGVFNVTVPGTESLSVADVVTQEDSAEIERRFTPEEAKQVGLVEESAVDWKAPVDIELGLDGGTTTDSPVEDTESDTTPLGLGLGLGLDINLELAPTEAPEPTKGAQLFEHVKLGFAYQMHLKDQWQKVRLTYVSPGRSFFVFTRGRKHQETISMTARMLARMCETGRMRAVESAYLLERATQRARKQLAALKTRP